MSLKKKIIILLLVVLAVGGLGTSVFFLFYSAKDKRDYIFDLQTTTGMLLSTNANNRLQRVGDFMVDLVGDVEKEVYIDKKTFASLEPFKLDVYKDDELVFFHESEDMVIKRINVDLKAGDKHFELLDDGKHFLYLEKYQSFTGVFIKGIDFFNTAELGDSLSGAEWGFLGIERIYPVSSSKNWPRELTQTILNKSFSADSLSSFYEDQWVVTVIPLWKDQFIVVRSSDEHLYQMMLRYGKRALPIIFMFLLLAAFGGFLFSKKLVEPLEQLTESTKKLAKGKWEVDIERTTDDEVGQLISAFKIMGKELKDREQELISKERLSAIGQFSAGLAHEIKNPLNVIASYSQLLERKLTGGSKEHGQAKVIGEEVRRATKIISDLMNYSRQKPLAKKKVSTKEFGDKLLDNVKSYLDSSIEIEMRIEGVDYIEVDEDLFFQVMTNLIDNAGHALGEKSGDKKIFVSFQGSGEKVQIKVTDNGSGISPEDAKKIFEPFYTTKKVGQGTGLGLAFCHGIVQQHGGEIKVESQSGQGTSFIISIPN